MNLIKCFELNVYGYASNYFNWKRFNPNTRTAQLASGTPDIPAWTLATDWPANVVASVQRAAVIGR